MTSSICIYMQVKFSVTVAIIIVKLVPCMYKQATVKTGLQLVLVVKISWVSVKPNSVFYKFYHSITT